MGFFNFIIFDIFIDLLYLQVYFLQYLLEKHWNSLYFCFQNQLLIGSSILVNRMLGSLEEFMYEKFQFNYQNMQKSQKQRLQKHKNSSDAEQKQKNTDQYSIDKSTDKMKRRKYHSLQVDLSEGKNKLSEISSRSKAKSKKDLFQADDKFLVFEAYKKVKRNAKKTSRPIFSPKKQVTKETYKQKSFLYLKQKLKHKHQILRSLVRVEENEKKSSNSFFDLSIGRIHQQFNTIVKKRNQNLPAFGQTTQKEETLQIDEEVERPKYISRKQFQKLNQTKTQNKRFLMSETSKKWVKIHSKSQPKNSDQKQKEQCHKKKKQNQSRKQFIKKISDIVVKKSQKKLTKMKKNSLSLSVTKSELI